MLYEEVFFMSHNPEEKQSNLDSIIKTNHLLIKIKFKTWQFILLLLGVVIITIWDYSCGNNWH